LLAKWTSLDALFCSDDNPNLAQSTGRRSALVSLAIYSTEEKAKNHLREQIQARGEREILL
jgi:hypothetical protein